MNTPDTYVITRTGGELIYLELKDGACPMEADARGCLDAPNFIAAGGAYTSTLTDRIFFPRAVLRGGGLG